MQQGMMGFCSNDSGMLLFLITLKERNIQSAEKFKKEGYIDFFGVTRW